MSDSDNIVRGYICVLFFYFRVLWLKTNLQHITTKQVCIHKTLH